MLTDYSSMEQEIKSAQEPKVLPRGQEVMARIVSVRSGTSEKYDDAQWFMPTFDVPDNPMVIEFNDFFWDLADREKIGEKQFQRGLNKFKKFAKAFDIDYSQPFDWETDLIGKTGWVIVGVKRSEEYGDSNTVSRYMAAK